LSSQFDLSRTDTFPNLLNRWSDKGVFVLS
jgi:hypothetical protein